MNLLFHPSLSVEKWRAMADERKLLNIASELSRAKNLTGPEGDTELVQRSLERALELVDLTVETGLQGTSRFSLRELLRFREALAGFYATPIKSLVECVALSRQLLDLAPSAHNLQIEI